MNLENYQAEVTGKFLEARYNLWNALLTVNGIILSVFGVFAEKNWVAVSVVIMAILSAGCMILTHVMQKAAYYRMLEVVHSTDALPTEEEKKRDLTHSTNRNKLMTFAENTTLVLFMVEMFAVALYVAR